MDSAGHSARAIGRQLGHSPNTITAYIARAAEYLADPATKSLVEKWKELEPLQLASIRRKLLARIEERVDAGTIGARDLIITYGTLFDKSRLLEGKSTINLSSILKVQQAALAMTMEHLSKPAGKNEKADGDSGQTPETAQQEAQKPKRTAMRA